MRKTLLFLGILLCLMACSNVDNDTTIDPIKTDNSYQLTADEAKEILLSFVGDEVKTRASSTVQIGSSKKIVYPIEAAKTDPVTRSEILETEYIPVYEFAIQEDENEGFALVVGDQRINTVLAYVPNGNLKDTVHIKALAEFMQNIPEFLGKEIKQFGNSVFARKASRPEDNMPDDYKYYEDSLRVFLRGFNESHACYVPTKWDQTYPYNANVPLPCTGNGVLYKGKAPIGCGAVAVAQVMAYHRQPKNFNWDLLLSSPVINENAPIDRKNEIGRLMRAVADSINAKYQCYGTSGSPGLIRKFGYDYDLLYATHDNFCENCYDHHRDNLIKSIKNNRPFIVSGQYHFYVVDAYGIKNYPVTPIDDKGKPMETLQTSYYYHLNMGWGGSANGWYLVYKNYLGRKDQRYNHIFKLNIDTRARGFWGNIRYIK